LTLILGSDIEEAIPVCLGEQEAKEWWENDYFIQCHRKERRKVLYYFLRDLIG